MYERREVFRLNISSSTPKAPNPVGYKPKKALRIRRKKLIKADFMGNTD